MSGRRLNKRQTRQQQELNALEGGVARSGSPARRTEASENDQEGDRQSGSGGEEAEERAAGGGLFAQVGRRYAH